MQLRAGPCAVADGKRYRVRGSRRIAARVYATDAGFLRVDRADLRSEWRFNQITADNLGNQRGRRVSRRSEQACKRKLSAVRQHDIGVTFRGYDVRRVHLEPGGTELQLTKVPGGVGVTAPRLDVHAVVVAELG